MDYFALHTPPQAMHLDPQQLRLKLLRSYWQRADHNWAYPSYQRPYNWLIYTASGRGEVETEQGTLQLRAGGLSLVPLDTRCHYRCLEPMRLAACALNLHLPHGPDVFTLYRPPHEPIALAQPELFESLVPLHPGLAQQLQAQGAAYLLLAEVLKRCQQQTPPDRDQQRLMVVLGHIDQHLSHSLPLAELARLDGCSESHFSRWFRRCMGLPVSRYIQQQRLSRATNLLIFSQHSVASIAQQVGFDDPLYFSRVFKQHTGLSPSHYRQQQQQENSLVS